MKIRVLSFAIVVLSMHGWLVAVDIVTENSLSREYSTTPIPVGQETKNPVSNAIPVVTDFKAEATPLTNAEQMGDWNSHMVTDALMPVGGMPPALNYFLNCYASGLAFENLVLVAKDSEEGECGLELVGLIFDYFDDLNLPEARSLIVHLMVGLIKGINGKEKLTALFNRSSITEDQVSVRIRVRPKHCGFIYPVLGNIAYISAMDGVINYGTMNSFTYEIESLRVEPYKQALNFVDIL